MGIPSSLRGLQIASSPASVRRDNLGKPAVDVYNVIFEECKYLSSTVKTFRPEFHGSEPRLMVLADFHSTWVHAENAGKAKDSSPLSLQQELEVSKATLHNYLYLNSVLRTSKPRCYVPSFPA